MCFVLRCVPSARWNVLRCVLRCASLRSVACPRGDLAQWRQFSPNTPAPETRLKEETPGALQKIELSVVQYSSPPRGWLLCQTATITLRTRKNVALLPRKQESEAPSGGSSQWAPSQEARRSLKNSIAKLRFPRPMTKLLFCSRAPWKQSGSSIRKA